MLFPALAVVAQALAVSAVPAVKPRQAAASAYASNEDLSLKLSEVDAPVQGAGDGSGEKWNLTVDDSEAGHKQTVKGFGGTVTDATVTVINALPADKRTQLLKELMTSDGANFSFLRHSIGASDLSSTPYTYDDTDGEADPSLGNFDLGETGTAAAKLLAEMKGLNSDATILGSPWSAPGWMKQSRVSSRSHLQAAAY